MSAEVMDICKSNVDAMYLACAIYGKAEKDYHKVWEKYWRAGGRGKYGTSTGPCKQAWEARERAREAWLAVLGGQCWKVRRRDERYDIYDLQLEDFVLSLTYLNEGKSTRGHSHHMEEAYYFISGQGRITVGKATQRVKDGDIVVIPKDTFHRVFSGNSRLVFLCIFREPDILALTGEPGKLPEVSIIVPCAGMLQMTKGCIDLIEKYTPPLYELIIVCDQPEAEMVEWLKALEKEGRARVIINPRLVSAPIAINMGIKMAKGKYVSLVMNDVTVTEGWLEPLLEVLKSHPEYGCVASRIYRGGVERKFAGMDCWLVSRETIDRVGLFDEIFSAGTGYDTNDYIRRMWAAGYSPHGVLRSTVYHPQGQTTLESLYSREEIVRWTTRNFLLFMQKWGNLPDEANMPFVD